MSRLLRAHLAYLRYVIIHKWYVFVECWRRGLVWQGVIHDLSKFWPDEWIPYVWHFHLLGNPPRTEWGEAFKRAWLRHVHRNPHHPEHYYYEDTALDIPMRYRVELLADWVGASRIQGNHLPSWYRAHRHRFVLHPDTRAWIETELERL